MVGGWARFALAAAVAAALACICDAKYGFLFTDSAVEELDETSLQRAIEGPDRLMITFYAPWCPHCQHFAPEYKEIAERFPGGRVRFAAVNCVEYSSLCRAHSIRGYPSVKVWRLGGKEPGERIMNSKDSIIKFIEDALAHDQGDSQQQDSGARMDTYEDREARLHDAVNSLEFVLRHELPQDAQQTAALRDLLAAAAAYLPAHKAARYHTLHQALLRLTNGGQPLLESAWKAELDAAQPVPVDTDNYRLCHVTEDGGYRFTCGLWQLFHIMSVGASKRFAADPSQKPMELLRAIRQFVDQLFKCEGCRSHFLEEYDGCQHGRCQLEETDGRGVMLWLWRMHNSVTARVKQDGPSHLWPSVETCQACRQTNTVTWEEERVVQYISQSYWSPDWELYTFSSLPLSPLLLIAAVLITAAVVGYAFRQRHSLFSQKKVLADKNDDADCRLEEGEVGRVDRDSVVHRRK